MQGSNLGKDAAGLVTQQGAVLEAGNVLTRTTQLTAELWSIEQAPLLLRRLIKIFKSLGAAVSADLIAGEDSEEITNSLMLEMAEAKAIDQTNLAALRNLWQSGAAKGIKKATVENTIYYDLLVAGSGVSEVRLVMSLQFHGQGNLKKVEPIVDLLVQQGVGVWRWIHRLSQSEKLVYRDDLTDLYNARYLTDMLKQEVARANRYGLVFSLFFIDLDNLKQVNDNLGHLAGTAVIKQFAEVLKEELRQVDSIVRYGGDEFLVLLLGAEGPSAKMVAERIRARVEAEGFSDGVAELPLNVTCSIGVASFPQHAKSAEELLQIADDSMYLSKRTGKNRVSVAENK